MGLWHRIKQIPGTMRRFIWGDMFQNSLRARIHWKLQKRLDNVRDLEPHENLQSITPTIGKMKHVQEAEYRQRDRYDQKHLQVTLTQPLTQDKIREAALKAGIKVESAVNTKIYPANRPTFVITGTIVTLTHRGLRKSIHRKRWRIIFDTREATRLEIRHYPLSTEHYIKRSRPLTGKDKKQIVKFVQHLQ
ncbi:hypothetical protein HY571_02955 [Candidatus Micrarchaeota archaeon]|nr:hypothetical protein [Candidatus Micrarchaeota archaeon]